MSDRTERLITFGLIVVVLLALIAAAVYLIVVGHSWFAALFIGIFVTVLAATKVRV